MKYRIKEIHKSEHWSIIKIQYRFLFIWFNVNPFLGYETTLSDARRWIKLKHEGYQVEKYYYE